MQLFEALQVVNCLQPWLEDARGLQAQFQHLKDVFQGASPFALLDSPLFLYGRPVLDEFRFGHRFLR